MRRSGGLHLTTRWERGEQKVIRISLLGAKYSPFAVGSRSRKDPKQFPSLFSRRKRCPGDRTVQLLQVQIDSEWIRSAYSPAQITSIRRFGRRDAKVWFGLSVSMRECASQTAIDAPGGEKGNMDSGESAWGRVGELAGAKSAKYPRFVVQIDEQF